MPQPQPDLWTPSQMESWLHKLLLIPGEVALGLGTRHMGGLGVWWDRVVWRTPARDWGSGRGRQGKGTRVWVSWQHPPPQGLCILPGAPFFTRRGLCAALCCPGVGGPDPVPLRAPPHTRFPRPAGEHGHWDPGVQQTRVQGRHHRQEAEGAGRVGTGSRTAPHLSRDDPKPPPPPSRSGDGGTEPLTDQGLNKF